MIGVVKRAWIPLLIVVVVVVAGFTVQRIRGFFCSDGDIVTTARAYTHVIGDAEVDYRTLVNTAPA